MLIVILLYIDNINTRAGDIEVVCIDIAAAIKITHKALVAAACAGFDIRKRRGYPNLIYLLIAGAGVLEDESRLLRNSGVMPRSGS